MGKSKIIYDGTTLIDLTSDTVIANKLAAGYTAHSADGSQIVGTMQGSQQTTFFKTLTYTSAVSTAQLIWSTSELNGMSFADLTAFDHICMTCQKTDSTHITYQVLFSVSIYPYFPYSSSSGNVTSGLISYHTSKNSSVNHARNLEPITDSAGGFFQITSSGIQFVADTTFKLQGVYDFALTAI